MTMLNVKKGCFLQSVIFPPTLDIEYSAGKYQNPKATVLGNGWFQIAKEIRPFT